MTSSLGLSDRQVDMLREIANIGAGHAASALSELLGKTVRISLSNARLCTFDEISEIAGGAESLVVGIFVRLSGDVSGNMLFMLSQDGAHELLQVLLPPAAKGDFSELELSALGEVGNILGGAYTSAIATMASLRIVQSVPAVAVDMAGAILDIGIIAAGEVSDSAILLDTSIMVGGSDIEGNFFVLPDFLSMPLLLGALQ